MKVKELIKWLKMKDEEAEVMIYEYDNKKCEDGGYYPLEAHRFLVRREFNMDDDQ